MAARKVQEYSRELRHKNEQLGRALAAARSATVAKSRFLASVSHELRTPLNGIIGFSELLHDGKLGPVTEEQVDVLGDILASARHLLQLINDVLDLSKVEAGRMEFRPGALPPARSRHRGERRGAPPGREERTCGSRSRSARTLSANLDPGRFKQVLYNYLSNAVKFTPAGGQGHAAHGGGRRGHASAWKWRIPASASRRPNCLASSRSSPSFPTAARRNREPAWGWPSRATWWRPRGARSRCAACSAAAAFFPPYCLWIALPNQSIIQRVTNGTH